MLNNIIKWGLIGFIIAILLMQMTRIVFYKKVVVEQTGQIMQLKSENMVMKAAMDKFRNSVEEQRIITKAKEKQAAVDKQQADEKIKNILAMKFNDNCDGDVRHANLEAAKFRWNDNTP